jgi:hypothetical protein
MQNKLSRCNARRSRPVILLALSALLAACGGEDRVREEAPVSEDASGVSIADVTLEKGGDGLRRLIRGTNKPPTISGTPSTSVPAGNTYSFIPTARDPEGAVLTFQVSNKPAWAQFSTQTGGLSGTPSQAQAGNYANVTISVSDGKSTRSLAPFAISVVAAAPPPPPPPTSFSATVSWAAPTTNVDGTPLTDLSGYKVYYGTNSQALDRMVQIGSASTTRQVVSNLTAGTWFFAVSALNATGLESSLSAIAQRTF